MAKKIKAHGREWELDGETWVTKFDRFHVITWQFGSIHQSKVFLRYELKIDGKLCDKPLYDEWIGVGLEPGKTRKEAMKIGLDWVEKFQKNGPETVEQSFDFSFRNYNTLYYDNRIPVIDHKFFTGGSGYHWVDGALMNCCPEEYKAAERRRDPEMEKVMLLVKQLREEMKQAKLARGEELTEDDEDYDEQRKKLWLQDVYEFYPVHRDYAHICQVPDDVRPDWLALAYEAAKLLRDKSGVLKNKGRRYRGNPVDEEARQAENRRIGAEVVAELERRFPHVSGLNQN